MTDHEGFDFLDMRRQQDRRQHRRHGEGRDDGADQRIGIGPRHRPEDLALHALHREQRQEGRDRDDHRKQDRLVDLDGAGQDPAELVAEPRRAIRRHPRRMMGDLAEDVFHHDHGAVDDNAEIDGADRQQIGGLAPHHRDHHSQKTAPPEWSPRRSARSADCRETPTGSGRSGRRRTARLCSTVCTVIATRSPRS